jgi:mRNA-degrading endonuclease toxin of MazEF toxin-antitoxin module
LKEIEEGSIVEIDVDDTRGHEQRGRRPALVVSVTAFQGTIGLAIVCPITTHGGTASRPREGLEVALSPGLPVKGVVLVHQLRTIDLAARNAEVIAKSPRATLLAVRARLKAILGL